MFINPFCMGTDWSAMTDHSAYWQPHSSPPSLTEQFWVPTLCQLFHRAALCSKVMFLKADCYLHIKTSYFESLLFYMVRGIENKGGRKSLNIKSLKHISSVSPSCLSSGVAWPESRHHLEQQPEDTETGTKTSPWHTQLNLRTSNSSKS